MKRYRQRRKQQTQKTELEDVQEYIEETRIRDGEDMARGMNFFSQEAKGEILPRDGHARKNVEYDESNSQILPQSTETSLSNVALTVIRLSNLASLPFTSTPDVVNLLDYFKNRTWPKRTSMNVKSIWFRIAFTHPEVYHGLLLVAAAHCYTSC